MVSDIYKQASDAASWIRKADADTRFRVISHYDADGITAAAIMCKALFRAGFDFHVTLMRNPFTNGIESVKNEENTHIIFTDMGSGQLSMIKDINAEILIIDHHQLKKEKTDEHIFQINANQCGLNGNYEACGATLSFAVAKALNKKNINLAGYAIAGATGDKQYIGGFRGFNKELIDEAVKKKIVVEHTGLKMSQPTIRESLYYSVEPFYQGISGDYDAIDQLCRNLGIEVDLSYNDLSVDEKKKIHSFLMLRLLRQGCESNILDTVIRSRYYSTSTYGEMEQFADLLDACGKGGLRDIGLSLCLGDEKSLSQAKEYEKSFKQNLLDSLIRLHDEIVEMKSYRYFFTEHTSLGGVIAGIAANFVVDKEKPLLSIARKDNELHISCRGNQFLVRNGLDLGGAMSILANEFKGHGGGHQIAAGATIPIDVEDKFIKEADRIFSKQIKI